MNQESTQHLTRHAASAQQTTATNSGAGSFALVLLMPVSFILTILTIVALQH